MADRVVVKVVLLVELKFPVVEAISRVEAAAGLMIARTTPAVGTIFKLSPVQIDLTSSVYSQNFCNAVLCMEDTCRQNHGCQ